MGGGGGWGGTQPPTLRHSDHTQTCSAWHAAASVTPSHFGLGLPPSSARSPSGTISTASTLDPAAEKPPTVAFTNRAPSTRTFSFATSTQPSLVIRPVG